MAGLRGERNLMSLRQVLTIYNAERRLDDDDIAWLDRLRNMTDAERALLIEQLSDKPQKKAGKKSAGGGGRSSKSARGSSIESQLSNRRQERGLATKDIAGESSNAAVCTGCDYGHDHNIHHHADMVGYHPFQPTEQTTAVSGD